MRSLVFMLIPPYAQMIKKTCQGTKTPVTACQKQDIIIIIIMIIIIITTTIIIIIFLEHLSM